MSIFKNKFIKAYGTLTRSINIVAILNISCFLSMFFRNSKKIAKLTNRIETKGTIYLPAYGCQFIKIVNKIKNEQGMIKINKVVLNLTSSSLFLLIFRDIKSKKFKNTDGSKIKNTIGPK